MQLTVKSIKPCDNHTLPKMEAVVVVYDDQAEFHNMMTIEVFIDKRDAPLSELKAEAIQTAVDFLKATVAAHHD